MIEDLVHAFLLLLNCLNQEMSRVEFWVSFMLLYAQNMSKFSS